MLLFGLSFKIKVYASVYTQVALAVKYKLNREHPMCPGGASYRAGSIAIGYVVRLWTVAASPGLRIRIADGVDGAEHQLAQRGRDQVSPWLPNRTNPMQNECPIRRRGANPGPPLKFAGTLVSAQGTWFDTYPGRGAKLNQMVKSKARRDIFGSYAGWGYPGATAS
jgi:hypothetical protein